VTTLGRLSWCAGSAVCHGEAWRKSAAGWRFSPAEMTTGCAVANREPDQAQPDGSLSAGRTQCADAQVGFPTALFGSTLECRYFCAFVTRERKCCSASGEAWCNIQAVAWGHGKPPATKGNGHTLTYALSIGRSVPLQ